MLGYFRKMRNSLLVENRFTRYFFYALGEIVLVVNGILIVLQINNRDKQRKRLQKELHDLSNYHIFIIKSKINYLCNEKNHFIMYSTY
jgi:hypothetical protein